MNCETLGEKKRKVKITILWVVRNVMCLPAPCIPASQGSSEITNENVHVAENSGEKNSANTDKKKLRHQHVWRWENCLLPQTKAKFLKLTLPSGM